MVEEFSWCFLGFRGGRFTADGSFNDATTSCCSAVVMQLRRPQQQHSIAT